MTIGRAFKFISLGKQDSSLRKQLNAANSVPELYSILKKNGLGFSPFDFEEALNYRLGHCDNPTESGQLLALKSWWEMLHRILGPESCDPFSECNPNAQCVSLGHCRAHRGDSGNGDGWFR